uniref:F-box/LRR-repeat protein At3g48880-like n=1 Tax=Fragaria vesca subsp. vesca TaxID=101020 RepID=UPI0005C7FC14|nr:PREDICTED: F-box/LRR-repeat protein At3g48880-like [Fragaria vesca subsp. vesca]
MDCLINVFGRVGMESLLVSVPFVCKSWHEATLDPLCWQTLSFPEFLPLLEPNSLGLEPFYYKFVGLCQVKKNTSFSITAFVRMVVARSHGKVVEIKFPGFINEETLRYVSGSCPGIRVLSLPDDVVLFNHSRVIAKLIGKWKLLEQLHLGGNLKKIRTFRADLDKKRMYELFPRGVGVFSRETIMDDILKQIGIHCKHFVGLRIAHAYKVNICNIVESLPNLKYLWFEECHFEGNSLVTLVKGCKQLEVLDLGKCGELEVDSDIGGVEEIANLAKDYGVEFLWQSGGEDGEEYTQYSLKAQMWTRQLLLNRGRVAPWMELARRV